MEFDENASELFKRVTECIVGEEEKETELACMYSCLVEEEKKLHVLQIAPVVEEEEMGFDCHLLQNAFHEVDLFTVYNTYKSDPPKIRIVGMFKELPWLLDIYLLPVNLNP